MFPSSEHTGAVHGPSLASQGMAQGTAGFFHLLLFPPASGPLGNRSCLVCLALSKPSTKSISTLHPECRQGPARLYVAI